MTEQGVKQRRPFHESIVDAIRSASYSDLRCLGALIGETNIPKGHHEILVAWQRRIGEFIREKDKLADVENILLEQKEEAEKKEEEKKAKEQVETATS